MATNSFLLKGWAITIVGALLALSLKEIDARYVLVSLVAQIFFWFLDSYYLSRERLFVKLHDHVRKVDERNIDFSMDTSRFRRRASVLICAVSSTMLLFYGGLTVVHLLVLYYLKA